MAPAWTSALAGGVSLAVLSGLERLFPLRRAVASRLKRFVCNIGTGAFSFAVVAPLQLVLLVPFLELVQDRRWGLLNVFDLPSWLAAALALLLFDATLWIWHWLNHEVELLWRFHLVHHVDRDLDASTALRFHFAELTLSIGWRAAQVLLIGATLFDLALFHAVLLVATLFHHSNLRLPHALERRLVWLLVTPRMHGIHHSNVREETNSNYSSILTLWDHLWGTLRLNVPQDSIRIGVPAYATDEAFSFRRIQLLPFRRGLVTWVQPGQEPPSRPDRTGRPSLLSA